MKVNKIKAIEDLTNIIASIEDKDTIYCYLLKNLLVKYSDLRDDAKITFFDIKEKYHDSCIDYLDHTLDIDIQSHIYLKIKIDSHEFTYHFDKIEKNDFSILLDEFFKGNYKMNLFSKSENSKIQEYEIIWDSNLLKKFNQRVKTYLFNIFGPKHPTFVKSVKIETLLVS